MKKSRKSKIVLLSVLGLATVSLATVGFASWVISGETPTSSQNITVSAGAVTDNTLKAEILSSPAPELNVAFDNTKVDNGLTGDYNEDLQFSFSVKVTGNQDVLSGIKFNFTLKSGFKSLFTNGYLQFITINGSNLVEEFTMTKGTTCTFAGTGVTFADSDNSSVKYSYVDGAGTFTCKFAFKWGSVFENVNPSQCYADKISDSDKATVISNLRAFDAAVKLVEAKPWMSVVVTPVATA